jgi:hypothetical protein
MAPGSRKPRHVFFELPGPDDGIAELRISLIVRHAHRGRQAPKAHRYGGRSPRGRTVLYSLYSHTKQAVTTSTGHRPGISSTRRWSLQPQAERSACSVAPKLRLDLVDRPLGRDIRPSRRPASSGVDPSKTTGPGQPARQIGKVRRNSLVGANAHRHDGFVTLPGPHVIPAGLNENPEFWVIRPRSSHSVL